jgi:hypothetical protein
MKKLRHEVELVYNHENVNVFYIGENEAIHWLKFSGGQAYDCSSE